MKDIREKLPIAIKTGKVVVGSKKTLENLLVGNPKLIVTSSNCPVDVRERIIYYTKLSGISHVEVESNTMEFGAICGKPFPVSALEIIDLGDSKII